MPFFDYELPEHLIAQHPLPERDASRLLVVRRQDRSLAHHIFRDLPGLLQPGDLLVLNDTKVIPARLVGRRADTGGRWEGLFLQQRPDGLWEMLAKTRGHPGRGTRFVTDSGLTLILRGRTDDHHWLMEPQEIGSPWELLERHGHVPLPPYIRKGRDEPADKERYQTVYASRHGSVAAPTAGLHFTPTLLAALATAGIATAHVTLHVGLGTFAPIKTADPRQHTIHREWCQVTPETAAVIRQTRQRHGRVVAVGTTTVRTLETAARQPQADPVAPFTGETDLYIYPPFTFRAVDALITNFHLPRTTLLLLVSAFVQDDDLLRQAYQQAIDREYRFYSYGDAMLIL
ncbi:MAG: tRNA preQ1(34) S-adenosylmethionine ribosyltransferase-isomerase QueA [Gemmataceae bacterium]|nr:tRNA preQ1(34) S-adenosylmethionine ribosyltransferase-isomerase QueA [Gemmataceae bacterium]MCS7272200.1 tRNA preQ1(34) S-adenosylmethionine ribosyltransferase-isomerase QueA [Gemmataceae bacterium]